MDRIGGLMLMHQFGEDGKLARDSGMAFHFVFGLFVAGYAASSSLARELRSGTAAAVLSKPVSREILFLAKFTGVAVVVIAFSACAAVSTLLSERISEKFAFTAQRVGYVTDWQTGWLTLAAPFLAFLVAGIINYATRRPFGSTAFALLFVFLLLALFISAFFDRSGRLAAFDPHVRWNMLPASLLLTLALIMLAALALSLSTRLTTTPTLTICSLLFVIGLMSDYLFGRYAGASLLAAALYWLLPNWQHFWVSDALTGGGTIPWLYVGQAALYALAYLGGILCLGSLSFRHTQLP